MYHHSSPYSYYHTSKQAEMTSNDVHSGKVAIITGSSKTTGIGAAIAVALAKQGANVYPLLKNIRIIG